MQAVKSDQGSGGRGFHYAKSRARLKHLLNHYCHFELDRRGKVTNYYDREPNR